MCPCAENVCWSGRDGTGTRNGDADGSASLVGEAAGGGGRGGAAIAGPDSRFDMNVVLLWLEQALPFLLILFCFFLREHLLEIGFFGERLHLSA